MVSVTDYISISPWLVWCVFQASVIWFLLHQISLLFDVPLQMSSPHEYWNQSSPDMPLMSMDKFFQAMDTKADDNKDNSLEVSSSGIIHFSSFFFSSPPPHSQMGLLLALHLNEKGKKRKKEQEEKRDGKKVVCCFTSEVIQHCRCFKVGASLFENIFSTTACANMAGHVFVNWN